LGLIRVNLEKFKYYKENFDNLFYQLSLSMKSIIIYNIKFNREIPTVIQLIIPPIIPPTIPPITPDIPPFIIC